MSAPGSPEALVELLDLLVPCINAAATQALGIVLDDIQRRMEPITPRTRLTKTHMQDVYSTLVVGGVGFLFNDQYYSNWVIHGTARSRNNPGLEAVLSEAEPEFATVLDSLIEELLADL